MTEDDPTTIENDNNLESENYQSLQAKEAPRPDEEFRYFGPDSRVAWIDLGELWRNRALVLILVSRDLKVKYRQTAIGLAWVIFQPLVMMFIFGFFLTYFRGGAGDDTTPYIVIFLCGYLPWQMFSSTVPSMTNSLIKHQALIRKIYFPRASLLLAETLSGMVDFAVSSTLLAAALVWFGILPGIEVLFLPVLVILLMLLTLGLGLWLASLNALYRDIGYMVPFLLQAGFFLSPIIYQTSQMVPEQYRAIYSLNPMAVIIDGFRWCLLGQEPPSLISLSVSTVAIFVILLTGINYFRRIDRRLADRI